MINLHPIIVHFPIALYVSALGFEILGIIFKKDGLRQTAWHNYLLGVLALIAAIGTGILAGAGMKHKILSIHSSLGIGTFIAAFLSSILLFVLKKRSEKSFRILFFMMLLVMSALVMATGFYGAKMVYEYGVGVTVSQ